MIVWLASYPKSGNTWVRMFLNSLIFTSDATVNINNIKLGQFTNITAFIEKISEIKFNERNIHKSIQNTKFENLKKQEELKGFKEKPKNSKKFFNLGPSNDWRNLLNKNIREKIETSFKNEMQDLGYL